MTITFNIDHSANTFPGDSSEQPPFGLRDSLRSLALYSVGIPHFAAWSAFVVGVSKLQDIRHVDKMLKLMSRMIPKLAGIDVSIVGQEAIDNNSTYVYVSNHVNIFDMFTIYQSIPHFARSLELIDHFSWPLFGSFIKAIGQIPVDPKDPRVTALGLKKAVTMIKNGDSFFVMPEGERTLDGSVGHFFTGAFRLAIKAKVKVVPMAIFGGRTVSRRGDWRIRPGKTQVIFGKPVSTEKLKLKDSKTLAVKCQQIIIELLQKQRKPGQ